MRPSEFIFCYFLWMLCCSFGNPDFEQYGYQINLTLLVWSKNETNDIPSFDNETLSTALSANDTLYPILNDKSDNDCDGLLIRTIESGNIMGTCIQNNETSYKLNIVSRENKIQLKILAKNFIHKWIHIIYETLAIDHIVQNCHLGSIAVRQFCLSVVDSVKLSWPEAESECVKRHGHLASIRSAYTQSMIDSMLLSSVYYSEDNAYWVGATDFAHEGDFPEAESECVKRHGHLASIRSAYTQSMIDSMLLSSVYYSEDNAYWVGATDFAHEGDFRWTDSLSFSYS
ncbi:uncharacterized protein LOC113472597, partial [Diaphorina citri]|uniref:Uncharacterized protein LOC113472597 n=1 Tax=Diaphorina citri TaxID=121845 RepID=A0A3Q0JIH2_DIACI